MKIFFEYKMASRPVYCITILFICFLNFSCNRSDPGIIQDYQLSSWQFHKEGTQDWLPAHVPGSVVSDLWRDKKINFITKDQINLINREHWEYRTIFAVPQDFLSKDVVDLCFDGLSADATIILNDSIISNTISPGIRLKISCKSLLRSKENRLMIRFHQRNEEDFLGIFRPVYLQAWSVAHITDIYFNPVSITPKDASYEAEITLSAIRNVHLTADLLINKKVVLQQIGLDLKKGENIRRLPFNIDKPKFWWPNGMGNQNVYDVQLVLHDSRGTVHDISQRLGVRTIEAGGTSPKDFFLKINGYPLFLKGAAYTPPDLSYPSVENFQKVLENAQLANFNLIRLHEWQTYETDGFYDQCDQKGILVWQDFPENDSSGQAIIQTIKRLRKHACIALWDNRGRNFVSAALLEFDPKALCLSSSSINSSKPGLYGGVQTGRIFSGFGFPAFGLMRHPLTADSFSFAGTVEDIYNNIRKSLNNNTITDYVNTNYGTPKDFDSEVYLTRLAQADVMKSIIETNRLNMPQCMGSVYEEINDSKAGISSSTISFSDWWKPAHYTVKDAFSRFLVILVRENGLVKIYVSSDALKEIDAFLLVKMIDFEGTDIFVRQMPVEVTPNTTSLLLTLSETELLTNTDKRNSCLVVQLNQANKTLSQNLLYFTEPKNLLVKKASIEIDVNETLKGYNLILKSPVLIKNIFIETISRTGWFSENNFDLLPGKRTRINMTYPGTRNELLKDIRIRSLVDIK